MSYPFSQLHVEYKARGKLTEEQELHGGLFKQGKETGLNDCVLPYK
jgi:hypothetical protein